MTQQALTNRLDEYLKGKGLKKTHQRDIIVGILFEGPHRHYQIEEVLAKARKKDPHISYVTVYRTLMMLVDARLVIQRQFGKGPSRFEVVSRDHHDHLICTSCGSIIEFKNDTIEGLQEKITKRHGFLLTHHKMELYGLCPQCRK